MTAEGRNADGKDALDHSAALRGASMAFGKPPLKPKPQGNTYSGTNGALAAATKVGTPGLISRNPSMTRLDTPRDEQRLVYQRSGESSTGSPYTPDLERRLGYLDRGHGLLHPDQSKSPSFIAATLAASRSVTPNHTGQQQQAALQRQSSFTRRKSPGSVRSMSSRSSLDLPLDTSSIAPTTSLIGMFEQNEERPVKRPAAKGPVSLSSPPRSQKPQKPLPPRIRTPSPKPQHTISLKDRTPPPQISKPQNTIPTKDRAPSPQVVKARKPEIKSPKPTLLSTFSINQIEPSVPLPTPRKPSINTSKPDPPKKPQPVQQPSTPASRPIPIPSKPRPQNEENHDDDDEVSSDDSFVSANDYRPSFRVALQNQNRLLPPTSAASLNSSAAVDSLANAIVASSLASSRAASPSKPLSLAPPPPPSRRNHNHTHLFHNSKEISRTPSPAKVPGLRTTMRKPKEEEEDERAKRRGKKNLMKKHPNKHHEGDRKRWRDQITERERKRYEAVWASNKGLYTPPGFESAVCSLVVRDIFSRSRLDSDVLEEVYALVDRQADGLLRKEEFVVGLWLIDQRLKGRKLPIRVSESVWRSVGILSGIKVRKAGK